MIDIKQVVGGAPKKRPPKKAPQKKKEQIRALSHVHMISKFASHVEVPLTWDVLNVLSWKITATIMHNYFIQSMIGCRRTELRWLS